MSERSRHSDELGRLERENSQLRHRIYELEGELNRLRFDMGMKTGKDDISKLWRTETRHASLMNSRSYVRYVISLVKSTSVWGVIEKGISHFRKFRLLSAILRTATKIAVLAESGVAFVAWISVSLFTLPFIAVISLASFLVAILKSRTAIKHFEEKLKDRKVYILFASSKQLRKNRGRDGFLAKNAEDLALDGSVVFIVSPYSFVRHGVGGSGFYVTAREEKKNIYMVRRNFFFMLRKSVIERVASDTVTMY